VNLESIAVRVSRDLKDAVFVGAFAVVCHVGPYRRTRDIDLALTTPMSDEAFEELGYRIFEENGKKVIRTREGVKLDVYTRDVSGIPVSDVFKTAVVKRVGSGNKGHVPGGLVNSKRCAPHARRTSRMSKYSAGDWGRPCAGMSLTPWRRRWNRPN
jgi:hypothetical protein